ncbi:PREDICTED: integral membrane protein GPR137C [Nanorana parkeri]|uniref:integral membrane protein GPR137C n=1 Tax=Nanorana parkeri TaxID=125878 RepID=UPI0008550193|nr:PREDICTED: integral membrane protein GPR137C [Nanorana parkeri]
MTAAAIPWPVELGLTVLSTGLCSLFFLNVYVQLWLLLHYRQKRLSYQSLLLFLCLLWAACRTVLFSFYLTNCARANELQPFPHWLLYCSPICLQFFTLCLLNLYFSQVIFKARCSPEFNRYKIPLHFGFLLTSLAFLIVNLSCILIGNSTDNQHGWITMTRVIFSDCLFAACSISLANNTYRIANMSPAYVYLESKGTSGSQAVVTGSVISVLYILRAFYNLVIVSIQPDSKPTPFSYGWNGVSDHVVTEETNDLEYFLFVIILLICEFLPMSLMACFFRAKKLSQNLEAAGMVNSHSFGSRAYFFDNPRRYDSDDDLPRLAGTRGERGSLSSTPKSSGWYGTICYCIHIPFFVLIFLCRDCEDLSMGRHRS